MELTCICCGKLWDALHVLREAPGNFNRQGAIIRACPSCHGAEPDGMAEKERTRLRAVARAYAPDFSVIWASTVNR